MIIPRVIYRLPISLVLVAALVTATACSSPGHSVITVGGNVLVSGSDSNVYHMEVVIGADPSRAGRLIACTQTLWSVPAAFKGRSTVAYTSQDGGATWRNAIVNPVGTWDPDCLFDAHGRAYFIYGLNYHQHQAQLAFTNRAGSWQRPLTITNVLDRPWITAGNSDIMYETYIPPDEEEAPSRGPDSVGHSGALVTLNTTDWKQSAPMLFAPFRAPGFSNTAPGNPVVLPDGTYVHPIAVRFFDPNLRKLLSNPPGDISNMVPNIAQPTGMIIIARLLPGSHSVTVASKIPIYTPTQLPSMAVDSGSAEFKGRVYLAFSDWRSGRQRVYVVHSDDRGTTWSAPRAVDDDTFSTRLDNAPDDNQATVAVNKDGVVGMSWHDRRDVSDNISYYERFTASLDGGESWIPSVRVSDAPNRWDGDNPNILAFNIGKPGADGFEGTGNESGWTPTQGHTSGLAADANGDFHPLWVDNRTGNGELYTAAISVAGVVSKYGDPALNSFEDVSHLTAIKVLDCRLWRNQGKLTVTLQVANRSKNALHDVRLRIGSMTSPIATLTQEGNGIYRIASVLEAKSQSIPITVNFSVSNFGSEYYRNFYINTLVKANLQVLALPMRRRLHT